MKGILPIEIPPTLDKKCKLIAVIITLLLLLLPLVCALYFWYESEQTLIALFLFIFLQFVAGVITSKMRIVSIPFDQIDIDYTTYEIVKWYIHKHLCFKNDTISQENKQMNTIDKWRAEGD